MSMLTVIHFIIVDSPDFLNKNIMINIYDTSTFSAKEGGHGNIRRDTK
jgi:hypothetical protein